MAKLKTQNLLDDLQKLLFGMVPDWTKLRDVAKNNHELGVMHFKLGNYKDAVFRLKIATRFDPNNADAWYYLGRAYLAQDELSSAATALNKAQKIKSTPEGAYMLAIAVGRKTPANLRPKSMPPAIALEYFDGLAPAYAKQQVDSNYQGHVLLCNLLKACMTPGRINHALLELGVGTGLCGVQMREVCTQIIGVDMSGKMLDQAMGLRDAQGNKTYDALIKQDLNDYLREALPESADAVLASSVASYLGDLKPLFDGAGRVLKAGGLFAFSADSMVGQEYQFDPETGRFAFAKTYLEGLAQQTSLAVVKLETAEIYPGHKAWLCILQK